MGRAMFVVSSYWMWTSGTFSTTVTFALNPTRSYLMTGALTGKDGGNYGQVYISMLCTVSGDQVLCGIRDDPSDSSFADISSLGINEFISNADSVTVKLRATGGLHRAEGILYDIT
jgi:hypothetical protein